ncbi:MAG: ribonucleoside-diphosphate reductase subunit alpha [Candidatus Babeliales bacterium]
MKYPHEPSTENMTVTKRNGLHAPLALDTLRATLSWACTGYETVVSSVLIIEELRKNIFNNITTDEIEQALIFATITFIEQDPAYGYVAAKLLLKRMFKPITGASLLAPDAINQYHKSLSSTIEQGIEIGTLNPDLRKFDLDYLAKHLDVTRDNLFDYMGLKILHERYLIKKNDDIIELPQIFWMRIAMGLALNETNYNEQAVAFYELMSTLRYVPSTPTLFHSGFVRAQLSSCFLNVVSDDLNHIFKVYGDQAQMSKYSGGVGTSWTQTRATGTKVKSINIESQGLIPFLKIANDVTAAICRSGKRRSAACVYLEIWHLDVEDFLDLRNNTGDERRRAHDISTALWVSDLFMKRMLNDEQWTLFSPDETPDLPLLYGKAFEEKYITYEKMAAAQAISKYRVISAKKLWIKILQRIFETGHPWITFKDPSNVRSPQDHVGVIQCSNLCTEITLNTSPEETAVCNLGSINLPRHMINNTIDKELIKNTVTTALRMLDNVIDLNFYPTKEARASNIKHRPVGLGMMGFQDLLYHYDLSFEDKEALTLADELMELIAYHAISASSGLAKERGTYASYKGSKWDRGLLPQDTLELLEQERGEIIDIDKSGKLDWSPVREHIKKYGMRNSNCMAIAPTATISNIAGCYPSFEPIYSNLYVKANMCGEFTVINKYLVEDLKKAGLWNTTMLELIKYCDGSIQQIDAIPDKLKQKYKGAFELNPEDLLLFTAVRSKWIDQSQSHNIFMQGTSGSKMHNIYVKLYKLGFKTSYYFRTKGITQIEKSTLDAGVYGFTHQRTYETPQATPQTRACMLSSDPECEACQ